MRGLWPFLRRLKYETVIVHLNDGSEVLGVVEEIDSNMNTELRHVKVIRDRLSPVYLDVIYIRGRMIWYYSLPDALPLEKLLGTVGEEEKEEKIPHMCESIGHRPLRGRCPAPPSTSTTIYISRARVPLTI